MSRHPYFGAFIEGFIGSFILAAVIITAIPKAVIHYVNVTRSHEHYE